MSHGTLTAYSFLYLLRATFYPAKLFWSEGLQEGRQEGRQEGEANLVLRQLNRRVGDISPELLPNIRSLDLEQLENLGEALMLSVVAMEIWNYLETAVSHCGDRTT